MMRLGQLFAVMAMFVMAIGSAVAAPKYKVGLQLYTVRDECAKDFPAVIKAVGKMGFTGVEFAGYYGRTAQELRKMLDENHLECYGTHIALDTLLGDNFEKTVEFNKILGNKLLVVPSLPGNRTNTKEALLETCKVFNEISKRLKKYGMSIGYHNHAAEFRKIDGEYVWDIFFANTDKSVVIQFDTGNALSGGAKAADFLGKYPGRTQSVHFKDFSATNSQALLGEGDVDWKAVVPLMKGKAGVKWYIIEQESYPFPSLVCAEKCLRTFEQLMAAK